MTDLHLQPPGLDQRERDLGLILDWAGFGDRPQQGERSFAALAAPAMDDRDGTEYFRQIRRFADVARRRLEKSGGLVQVAQRLARKTQPVGCYGARVQQTGLRAGGGN